MRPIRLRLLTAACFLLLWGTSASAAIQPDLDRDGVPDAVTFVSTPRPHILIAFSSNHRLVRLPLRERLSSLVATDIDRDGLTDLAGTSSRGLMVWKNQGSQRFTRWRHGGKMRLRRGLTISTPGHRVHRKNGDSNEPAVEATSTDDQQISADTAVRSFEAAPVSSTRLFIFRTFLPVRNVSRSAASRAPPARSH